MRVIHGQLIPSAYCKMFSLRDAARRKKAGLSVTHIVRRFAEEKAAIWAEIERTAAARNAAGMDTVSEGRPNNRRPVAPRSLTS